MRGEQAVVEPAAGQPALQAGQRARVGLARGVRHVGVLEPLDREADVEGSRIPSVLDPVGELAQQEGQDGSGADRDEEGGGAQLRRFGLDGGGYHGAYLLVSVRITRVNRMILTVLPTWGNR